MSLQGSGSVAEMNNLLDNIAKATIEVFQQSADLNNNSSNSGMGLFNPNGIATTDAGSTRQNGIKTFLRYLFFCSLLGYQYFVPCDGIFLFA